MSARRCRHPRRATPDDKNAFWETPGGYVWDVVAICLDCGAWKVEPPDVRAYWKQPRDLPVPTEDA